MGNDLAGNTVSDLPDSQDEHFLSVALAGLDEYVIAFEQALCADQIRISFFRSQGYIRALCIAGMIDSFRVADLGRLLEEKANEALGKL